MSPSRTRETCLVLAAVLLLSLAGYGRLLRRGEVPYSVHSDIVSMHLAAKTVLHDSIRSGGGLPFWRSDQMAGVPAFTNPESQYAYPLHVLFYFLAPAGAVGPAIWAQLVAGALAMYWVGAVLGLGRRARLLMAVAQLYNFKLIAITYAGFLPVLPVATLFPLLFAALFRLIEAPGLKGTLLLAACAAICLSTGGFQLLYYAGLFLGGYACWQAAVFWRAGQRRLAGRFAVSLPTAALLAAGVVACLLIPLLAEAPLLSRSGRSYEFFLSGYTFTARHWINFLYPESFGRLADSSRLDRYVWEEVVYFGLVPLGLAIIGAVRGRRRRHVPFLAAGFAISLLLATRTPLTRALFEILPGFDRFRMPLRFVYLTGFFGIALAGIGLQETLEALRARRRPGPAGAPAAAGAALSWVVPVALILVIGAEGAFYARRYVTTKPAAFVLPRPDYADFFARDGSLFRIAPLFRDTVQPGWAAPLRLQLVTGALPVNLDHYRSFFEMLQAGGARPSGAFAWADLTRIVRPDLADVLNVKYLVSPVPLIALPSGFREAARLARQPVFSFFKRMTRTDLYIYRNDRFIERAFWAPQVVTVRDRSEMVDMMRRVDLRATAVVMADPGRPGGAASFEQHEGDRVTITGWSGGHLALETRASGTRFLVISEIWHPGWRASIDGGRLPLAPCDLALMGAWIPAGDHRIVLRFRPILWQLSLGITFGSLALWTVALAGGAVLGRRSHRRG
jgi:hypothetical protein